MTLRLAGALALALSMAAAPVAAAPPVAQAAATLPARAQVLATMRQVADWQLGHLDSFGYIPSARASVGDPRDWQQATFWVGMTALAGRSADSKYRDAILAMGRAQGWKLGGRTYHADDHLIGAVYLWAAAHGAGPQALAPMRATFDAILAHPMAGSLDFVAPAKGGDPECTTRWCWCDALFMAPPTLFGLTKATGDDRYAAFADREYHATWEKLFDPETHLFFRDSRFFDQRGVHGEKLFWSRGNGWVFSGLARLIPEMDARDPRRRFYVALFHDMAEALLPLQRANGYWPPSLLADPDASADESSGTALYVHGLAWGIKAGLLPRDQYLPAVTRGWAALTRALHPDGMLGWVQQVSDRPDAVAFDDTQLYGTGGFLLAGAAVADLAETR